MAETATPEKQRTPGRQPGQPAQPSASALGVKKPTTDKRFQIHSVTPSQVKGDCSYYSFRHVFARPCNVGVVGAAGFIGEFIAKNLPAGETNLQRVCLSSNPEKANDLALMAQVGVSEDQVVDHYMDMIKTSEVDAIVVATPNTSHYEIAKAALQYGKHVLCEKPVAMTSEQARELAELADAMGVNFTVNHFYSQYSQVANLSQIVTNGKVGIDPSALPIELELGDEPFTIELGELEDVEAEYLQGYIKLMYEKLLKEGKSPDELPKDLDFWRLNPEVIGPSFAFADIGIHALEVACRILGSDFESVVSASTGNTINDFATLVDTDCDAEIALFDDHKVKIRAKVTEQGTQNDLSVTLKFKNGTILNWSNRNANLISIESPQIPGGTAEIDLERDNPPTQNLSNDAEILSISPFGHDQGHSHAQDRLIRLWLDGIVRMQFEEQEVQGVDGIAPYSPDAYVGVDMMLAIEGVAEKAGLN